jgi:PhoH-like ATPase
MSKKIYVIDTNVFLSDHNAIHAFKGNDIVIPLKVLEEIDKHKKRQDAVGANARQTIRILDALREGGNLHDGLKIGKGKGNVSVKSFDKETLPQDLSLSDPDNQILATALTLIKENPDKKVILVSQDINMRVKCDSLSVPVENYETNQVVDNAEEIYTGTAELVVDDEVIDAFYAGAPLVLSEQDAKLFTNQYVTLVSSANPSKTALARFKSHQEPLVKVKQFRDGVWGVKARNREQQLALDVLMNDDIKVVSILGQAGCGKTLMAIAAGLQQVLDDGAKYKKLIVARPVQPMGRDIGFLPGTVEEKLLPWLAPIQDNLEALMNNDKEHLKMLIEDGTIELEALTYIRGRSISNAYILIDESQNLSVHEIKTILTRVGENTKIVLTGDVKQIDVLYLDASTNGLTHAVEKFKPYDIAGHISLVKGERSAVASLAAEIL